MRKPLSLIPSWKPLLAVALPVLLGIGAVAGAYAFTSATTKAGQTTTAAAVAAAANADVPAPAGLLVHVVGAVEHPGLYRLKRGGRVYEAIAAAGGLSGDADITRLPNLAGRLKDGEQIKVPYAKGTTGGTGATPTNLNQATVQWLEGGQGFTSEFA